MSQLDPVLDRPLGGLLELEVDRQTQGVARLRLLPRLEDAARAPARVDAQLRQAGLPAQVAVVDALDSSLADAIARAVVAASVRLLLQLLGRDLADVAEDVRAERQVGVVPQRGRVDVDAAELVLVLEDVGRLRPVDAALDRDRGERIGHMPLQQPDDRPRRHLEDGLRAGAALPAGAPTSSAGPAARRGRSSRERSSPAAGRACRRSSRAAPRSGPCGSGCSAPRPGSAFPRAPAAPTAGTGARRRRRARAARGCRRAARAWA